MHEDFTPVEGHPVVYQIAKGEYRPAQIVRVWSEDGPRTCNLVVFVDGSNDKRHPTCAGATADCPMLWKTSVILGEDVGQYKPRTYGKG